MIVTDKHGRVTPEIVAGAFGMALFALHCWSAYAARDPRLFLMHGIAFLYDAFLLAISAVTLEMLWRNTAGAMRSAIEIASIFFISGLGLTLASYPLLLEAYFGFPINIFTVDFSVARFFLAMVFGSSGALAVLSVAILAAFSIHYRLRIPLPQKRLLFWGLTIVSLAGIALSLSGWRFMTPHPHPLVYSMQETVKDWLVRQERVVPRLARPPVQDGVASVEPEPSPLESATNFRYDHILIFVMETVNEARFARDFIGRKTGFFAQVKKQAVYFNKYYTTNLDSYTALIAMLTSVEVPYRAYDAPKYFAGVNQAPNLVGALGRKGWKSLFVCTAEHQPFIPVPQFWSKKMRARDLPNKGDWVSVGLNAVEAATEDKAAIAPIVSFVKAHPRTVIMHEMVFGHSSRWRVLTGKGQLEYYDEFLRELYEGLRQEGLAEKALIVVVADHGERTDSAVAENYHVPLLIVGKGIEASILEGMFSHADLQQIIAHYLSDQPLPKTREDVMVVGHTGRWVYGRITKDGRFHFIDALKGVVLSEKGGLSPRETFDRFQANINAFARYQQHP